MVSQYKVHRKTGRLAARADDALYKNGGAINGRFLRSRDERTLA
jgi:hypothetical protein